MKSKLKKVIFGLSLAGALWFGAQQVRADNPIPCTGTPQSPCNDAGTYNCHTEWYCFTVLGIEVCLPYSSCS